MVGELTRVLRILRKSPVFALTAIVTLTLAVAENLAAFSNIGVFNIHTGLHVSGSPLQQIK
jgi:hypothetical protein